MKKNKIKIFLSIFFAVLSIVIYFDFHKPYDVTVAGNIGPEDGVGKQSIDLMNLILDDFSVNFIDTTEKIRKFSHVTKLTAKLNKIIFFTNSNPGKIVILEAPLPHEEENYLKKIFQKPIFPVNNIGRNEQIYIAYSMFESNSIPKIWVNILNEQFDMVAVPSKFLLKVYKDSGVKIPVFLVPLGMNLEGQLSRPIKKSKGAVFRFGTLGTIEDRKNQLSLIYAFERLYKNRKDIELIINGRRFEKNYLAEILEYISANKIENIKVTTKKLKKEAYENLIGSIDSFVYLSKGEGFSIQPREAMALGIPTIVTNNTGQMEIVQSALVRSVESKMLKPAIYRQITNEPIGQNYNLDIKDAVDALADVYNNYDKYLLKSEEMRRWAERNQYENLKGIYYNMLKPKKVIFGDRNEITNDYLMTDSDDLYKKYVKLVR